MNIIQGKLYNGEDIKIGIVIARFNDFLTKSLLSGCEDGLTRSGVLTENIDVAWVPGAYEIPLTAATMAETGKYDAIITLGAVIRGATSHFDVVVNQASSGVSQVSLMHKLPVIFGVLTVENIEQAIERSGTKAGNLGFTYATNAIEMINLFKEIKQQQVINPYENISNSTRLALILNHGKMDVGTIKRIQLSYLSDDLRKKLKETSYDDSI